VQEVQQAKQNQVVPELSVPRALAL